MGNNILLMKVKSIFGSLLKEAKTKGPSQTLAAGLHKLLCMMEETPTSRHGDHLECPDGSSEWRFSKDHC